MVYSVVGRNGILSFLSGTPFGVLNIRLLLMPHDEPTPNKRSNKLPNKPSFIIVFLFLPAIDGNNFPYCGPMLYSEIVLLRTSSRRRTISLYNIGPQYGKLLQ